MLLAKAYAALPEGGALVVYAASIDDERKAGFRECRVEHLAGPDSMAVRIR